MKKNLKLIIALLLIIVFGRMAFATDVLEETSTLETLTTVAEEIESSVTELETTVEESTTIEESTTVEETTTAVEETTTEETTTEEASTTEESTTTEDSTTEPPVEDDTVTTLEPEDSTTVVEPTDPEDGAEDGIGKIEAIKNALTTLLEQSEKARTVYYIINTFCTLISVLMLVLIGKKNKKHNSEITKEVCNQVAILYNKQITDSIAVIEESVKPVFEQLTKSQEAVVKSVALLHLNDNGAAMASLECLSEVLSADAQVL